MSAEKIGGSQNGGPSDGGAALCIGHYEVYSLVLDRFRLDGGAMFGSVPKPLWEKRIPADGQNRIQLAARALVLKSADSVILLDLGCGDKWEAKQNQIYVFEPQVELSALKSRVTDVVISHLHFDHCGGISSFDAEKKAQLNFPEARIYIQEKNWERAQQPGPRERATYLPENVQPLNSAKLKLTKNGQEIFPGIKVFEVNGHTDGMQWTLVGDGENAVAFLADLVPTAHHLPIPYLMGYDLCASTTMREKAEVLEEAVKQGWWVAFDHDADTCLCKVLKDAKGNYSAGEKRSLPDYNWK